MRIYILYENTKCNIIIFYYYYNNYYMRIYIYYMKIEKTRINACFNISNMADDMLINNLCASVKIKDGGRE